MLDFAQFEREMTSERTRDKMHQRAAKGYWNGGGVPFGYSAENKQLVVNSDEAPLVRLMFEIFAKTGSLARVREEFKLRGFRTRSGANWGKTSIDNIIRNPVYVGRLRYKDQLYPSSHPSIIEEATFIKAQSVHRSQTHVSTRIKRAFLLKGLLKCAECGSLMSPHYAKKKTKNGFQLYFYYRCSRVMHHDKTICNIRQVPAEKIETLVLDDIGRLIADSPLLVSAIENLNSNKGPELKTLKSDLKEVRNRISELDSQADNFVEALGKGMLSAPRLEKALEKIEQQKLLLGVREQEMQDKISEKEIRAFDSKLIQENLRKFRETFSTLTNEEKPECLQMILKDVVLGRDTIQLDIFDLPDFDYANSSKNRTERLLR